MNNRVHLRFEYLKSYAEFAISSDRASIHLSIVGLRKSSLRKVKSSPPAEIMEQSFFVGKPIQLDVMQLLGFDTE